MRFERMERNAREQDVPLAANTLATAVGKLIDLFDPVVGHIRERALSSSFTAFHATRMPVLDGTHPLGIKSGALWLIEGDHHVRSGDGANAIGCLGDGCRPSSSGGSHAHVFSIPGPNSAFASEPKARAQCGNSARWDPCGGRPEPKGKGRPYRDPCIAIRIASVWAALATRSLGEIARARETFKVRDATARTGKKRPPRLPSKVGDECLVFARSSGSVRTASNQKDLVDRTALAATSRRCNAVRISIALKGCPTIMSDEIVDDCSTTQSTGNYGLRSCGERFVFARSL